MADTEKNERFTMELLSDVKSDKKRLWQIVMALIVAYVITVFSFLWYMSQYDYSSSYEANGIYALIDSEGNIISSDITSEELKEILEIINNGNNTSNPQES